MSERFVICEQLVFFVTNFCFLSLEAEKEPETEEVARKKKGDGGQEGEKCKRMLQHFVSRRMCRKFDHVLFSFL